MDLRRLYGVKIWAMKEQTFLFEVVYATNEEEVINLIKNNNIKYSDFNYTVSDISPVKVCPSCGSCSI
jgi:hypothetical protein